MTDYLPAIERVARALPRHMTDDKPDIPALAFALDMEPGEVRRHVCNLRRRTDRPACLAPRARSQPHTRDLGDEVRAAIPAYTVDGRLPREAMAKGLGICRRTLNRVLDQIVAAGVAVPPRQRPMGGRPDRRAGVLAAVAAIEARGEYPSILAVAREAGVSDKTAGHHLRQIRGPLAPAPPRPGPGLSRPAYEPTPDEIEAALARLHARPSTLVPPGEPETWRPVDACRLYLEEWKRGALPGFMARNHRLDQINDDHDAA